MNKLVFAAVVAFFSMVSVAFAIDVTTPDPKSAFDMQTLLNVDACDFGTGEATGFEDCAEQAYLEISMRLIQIELVVPREDPMNYAAFFLGVEKFNRTFAVWHTLMNNLGKFETMSPDLTKKLNDIEVMRRKAEHALVERFWVVMNHSKQATAN